MSQRLIVELENVSHRYEKDLVLKKISCRVYEGEIACLLGMSGCGKTTLLRTIAGFETICEGSIKINGREVSSSRTSLSPEKRRIGVVFQDYALFPHLTVLQNVAFGIRHLPQVEISEKVDFLLQSVALSEWADRYPSELSGGQQQRVALIRALAPEPALLLLDEPFSNLDHNLREKMKHDLKVLLKGFGVTAIMVTHNQDEAFDIADRIGIMNGGKMEQWDSAYKLYHEPNNHFVASFLGYSAFLPLKKESGRLISEIGVVDCQQVDTVPDEGCSILIRPDDIAIEDKQDYSATIERIAFRGMYQIFYLVLTSGSKVHCFTSSHDERFSVGQTIGLKLTVRHIVLFDNRKRRLISL